MTEAGPKRRRMPAWVPYTVLRVLLFAVPLAVTYGLTANLLVAAIVATVVGFCLSLLFLNRQRLKLAAGIAEARHGEGSRRLGDDESAEDEALTAPRPAPDGDAAQGSPSASARPTP